MLGPTWPPGGAAADNNAWANESQLGCLNERGQTVSQLCTFLSVMASMQVHRGQWRRAEIFPDIFLVVCGQTVTALRGFGHGVRSCHGYVKFGVEHAFEHLECRSRVMCIAE